MSVRLAPGRAPRACRAALAVAALLAYAAALPLTVISGQLGDGVTAAVIGIPCTAVGWAVTRRQPGNAVGWLFLVTGLLMALTTAAGDYGYLVYRLGHRLPLAPAGLALTAFWGPSLVLFGLAVLLFPDGRVPPGFWRAALRAYVGLFAALVLATAAAVAGALASHLVRVDSTAGLAAVDHPAGWYGTSQAALGAGILGLTLLFILRQALSWRRAAGDRRQQLKWLAAGAAVSVVSLVLATAFSTPGRAATLLGVIGSLAWFGVAALPVSIGVAILKYRLYDIDRIISRTLAYAIVTGLLVGAYAGMVLLATGVLRFSSPVAVAGATLVAATLVAAALFSPVRRRVQRAVDRRFNRARYDADLMVAAFAARLQDAVDPDAVRADLAAVVNDAMQPSRVSIWLRR